MVFTSEEYGADLQMKSTLKISLRVIIADNVFRAFSEGRLSATFEFPIKKGFTYHEVIMRKTKHVQNARNTITYQNAPWLAKTSKSFPPAP